MTEFRLLIMDSLRHYILAFSVSSVLKSCVSVQRQADPRARMANTLRGIVVLLAVAAVLSAASFDQYDVPFK